MCYDFQGSIGRIDAEAWLKPGAWGCETDERPPKRRGFRPTFFGYCGRARQCGGAHGSNPAHGDAKRMSSHPSAEVFALAFLGIAGAPGCTEAPMAQTRRMGMPNGTAQLPKRRGFRPYRQGRGHKRTACSCALRASSAALKICS